MKGLTIPRAVLPQRRRAIFDAEGMNLPRSKRLRDRRGLTLQKCFITLNLRSSKALQVATRTEGAIPLDNPIESVM